MTLAENGQPTILRVMKSGVVSLLCGLLLLGGCNGSKPKEEVAAAKEVPEAERLLKWSMDTYGKLASFQTTCDWKSVTEGEKDPATAKRTFAYEKPNKFKTVARLSIADLVLTTVSDGKSLVEYSTDVKMPGRSYPSPADLATASSMVIRHPMFGGTLLNFFFGGSANYDKVVDTKKPAPSLGVKEKTPTGEEGQVIKFYGTDTYGNVEALIGLKTGFVYRLTYDNEGLRQIIESMPDKSMSGKPAPKMVTTETYTSHSPNPPIEAKVFDTTFPKGVVERTPAPASTDSPLPTGKPAPNFEVKTMDGQTISLASLRGKVVFIDFWATWCPPCREGLPITDKLHRELSSKGVVVLAVSDEDKETVGAYVKEHKFEFTSCIDTEAKMAAAYKVESIPTTVIIDREGNLSTYLVGLGPEGQLREELAKVGVRS